MSIRATQNNYDFQLNSILQILMIIILIIEIKLKLI